MMSLKFDSCLQTISNQMGSQTAHNRVLDRGKEGAPVFRKSQLTWGSRRVWLEKASWQLQGGLR